MAEQRRMTKVMAPGAAGAALLLAGIFLGRVSVAETGGAGNADPRGAEVRSPRREAAERQGEGTDRRTGRREKAGGDREVRTSIPPGTGTAWLIEQAGQMTEDDMTSIMYVFQQCAVLDKASSREVFQSALELATRVEAEDPDLPKAVKEGQFLELTLMISAFRQAQHDPAAALEMIARYPEAAATGDTRNLVFGVISHDDPGRSKQLMESAAPEDRSMAIGSLVSMWGKRDPEMVYELLSKYPGDAQDEQRNGFIRQLAEADPRKALEMAVKFAEAGGNDEVIVAGLTQMNNDEEARNMAREWAEGYHGPGEARVKAFLLQEQAAQDPRAAAEEFRKLAATAGEADLSDAARMIAGQLAASGYEEAGRWTDSLPAGPVRASAEYQLADVWVKEDPKGAGAWITGMPDGPVRQKATMKLIEAIKVQLPEDAFQWGLSIKDMDGRMEAVDEVYQAWKKQDPEAAEEAVGKYKQMYKGDVRKEDTLPLVE